ncbi:MAG: polyprenol monophosphomannose synthase [Planctomycetota bacterium]
MNVPTGSSASGRRGRSQRRRLEDLFTPQRFSSWEAPPPSFQTIASPDAVPEQVQPGPGAAFLVPDFELAEILVSRGANSSRIAVDRDGTPGRWLHALEAASPLDPLVPPQPFEFPWRCCVVLPTYNEIENLEHMLAAIHRYLACDILVVDDNSPDGTGRAAERFGQQNERVHVLHRAAKEGLGRAYLAGFAWALERGYERIFEMDCDFSHGPWDLPRLAAASADADLVLGSRYVPGGRTEGWVLRRRLLSRSANIYARLLLGPSIRDWTGGFRCYRGQVLASIDLDRVIASGYAFQVEMVWQCRRSRVSIRELPIRFTDRSRGTSKMGMGIALEAIRRIPLLRFRG